MRILHQHKTKEANLKRIFSMVVDEYGISRAKIARKTELSKTTVSSLIEELINGKFVIDLGTEDLNKQGRNPNMLAVNDQDLALICITLSKNTIKGSLVSLVVDQTYANFVETEVTEKGYFESIVYIYEKLLQQSENKKILGACFIIPGEIAPSKHINSNVLTQENTKDLIDKLRYTVTEIPIAFFDETACIAYGDKVLSKTKDEKYIYINMADYVNAAIFYNGKLLSKADGMQMQFGHFCVNRRGEKCSCGNVGCIENIVSQPAVSKIAKAKGISVGADWGYKQLGESADKGDADAKSVVDEISEEFAFALSNFIIINNVPKVVIGGKGKELGDLFISQTTEKLRGKGYPPFSAEVTVVYSEYADNYNLGTVGAAQYYINEHFSFLYESEKRIIIG